uniref:Putative gtpase activating protein n=1 Tax=Hyalomma excavatum TaxID=257692 RepID=A0A131X941_9ACAR
MQGPEALHLEDALEDNPQMRSMVNLFERDAHNLDKYVRVMYEHANRIWNAEKELADATASLAFHMRQYDSQDFPLDTDPDSILRATLRQLSSSLEEISSWHQMCSAHIGDGMVYPLSRFLESDLREIFTLEEQYNKATAEREQALGRYCKLSRRKDTDRQRLDLSEELYLANRRFHTVSLQFYAQLNALQYRRKIALIEPLLGYVHSMKSLFGVAHETMHTAEQDEFLANIATSLGEVQRELQAQSEKAAQKAGTLARQGEENAAYLAEGGSAQAQTGLSHKSGYLFHRTKIAGMVSRWDRVYFYILGCHLMHIPKGESVGSAVMEIDRGTVAHALDEDRRNVFQISNGKKSVVLQALSEPERDEWITTVMNVAAECHPGGRSHSVPKEAPTAKTERTPSLPNAAAPGSMPAAAAAAAPSQERKMARPRPATQQDLKELANTPIQFDMFSPSEDKSSSGHSPKDGPAVRINPFDQCGSSITMESAKDASCSFWEAFTVRFLGSMQVPCDRGDQLVCETMRLILAARMAHNVFKMAESHMVVSQKELRILDPSHQAVRACFPLAEVSFWTVHKDNNRLLGFITINPGENPPTYRCHVFEVNTSAEEVCNALAVAANIALKDFMGQQQQQQQEKQAQKEDEKQNEELLQKLKLSEDENALFPSSAKKVHSGAKAGEEAAAALLEAGDAKAT